jgi:4-aminobutyrate aminotransferase-like enzyme
MLKGPRVVSPQPGHQTHKIILSVGTNCIRIAPPLNISQELFDKGLDILFDAIKAVEGG